jgi:CRP-like cAMP-binding protein
VTSVDPFTLAEVDAAVARSVLVGLPGRLRDSILAGSIRSEISRARLLDGPALCLVVDGMIRVSLANPDGHRFTVSYLHRGDLAGLARVTGRSYPLQFETVTDCRLLRLDEATFDDLRRRHPEVGVAVAAQLNRHLDDTLHETALGVFGHVRERLLRHLLALAVIEPGGPATCSITHQQLADAVGAARETVSRIVSDLKGVGLVGGEHGALVILDPERLRRELTTSSPPSGRVRDDRHGLDDGGH